jgi:hypothetical protein
VSEAPRVQIEPVAVDLWRITNDGDDRVRLLEAWAPHGRFRADRRAHDVMLEPGRSVVLELPVRTAGDAGEVVENAFLILRFEGWRVLARLEIRFDDDASPRAKVMVVTSQPAGFSGVEG